MPGLVDGLHADVHHSPHYTMPERSRTPVVVTIHDMTFFDHPEWHERSKVLVFKRAIRRAALKAAVLVCVSQSTADRLVEHRGQGVRSSSWATESTSGSSARRAPMTQISTMQLSRRQE